jgi:hypothetical protein
MFASLKTHLAGLQEEQVVTPNGSRVSVEPNMLQNKVIGFSNDLLGIRTCADTADVIQVVLPKVYRQDRAETTLKDGLHLGEMAVLELKLGILDPIPRL